MGRAVERARRPSVQALVGAVSLLGFAELSRVVLHQAKKEGGDGRPVRGRWAVIGGGVVRAVSVPASLVGVHRGEERRREEGRAGGREGDGLLSRGLAAWRMALGISRSWLREGRVVLVAPWRLVARGGHGAKCRYAFRRATPHRRRTELSATRWRKKKYGTKIDRYSKRRLVITPFQACYSYKHLGVCGDLFLHAPFAPLISHQRA